MPESAHLLGHWTGRVAALNPIPDGMPIVGHAREEGDWIAHDVMCQRTEEFVRWHWQPLQKMEVHHQFCKVCTRLLLAERMLLPRPQRLDHRSTISNDVYLQADTVGQWPDMSGMTVWNTPEPQYMCQGLEMLA